MRNKYIEESGAATPPDIAHSRAKRDFKNTLKSTIRN